MRNALIIHGKPSEESYWDPYRLDPSDRDWLPWAKRQLTLNGIPATTPDMPEPYRPTYDAWAHELERYDITPETVLVGLSAGAGFLVEWMSRNKQAVIDKLVLVAPWTNPNKKYENFFTTPIDTSIPERCLGGMAIFYSSDDDEQAQRSFGTLHAALPSVPATDIPGYGHFMLGNNMQDNRFPELITYIVGQEAE